MESRVSELSKGVARSGNHKAFAGAGTWELGYVGAGEE